MDISLLLKLFREYEQYYMGDKYDHVEWQHEFMEFVAWIVGNNNEQQVENEKLVKALQATNEYIATLFGETNTSVYNALARYKEAMQNLPESVWGGPTRARDGEYCVCGEKMVVSRACPICDNDE